MAQFVARSTSDFRFVLLVAVHAPFHLHRLREFYFVLLHHISVATAALNLRRRVPAVAKENEVRQSVNTYRWYWPFADVHMARLALGRDGELRQVATLSFSVAG